MFLGLGLIGAFAGTRWRVWWLVESASAVAWDLRCCRGTVSQWRQEAEVKLVCGRKGGTVQAGQARHAQAVLAGTTPSPLNTCPKALPSFNESFIRGHRHFLTQTYSHPRLIHRERRPTSSPDEHRRSPPLRTSSKPQ